MKKYSEIANKKEHEPTSAVNDVKNFIEFVKKINKEEKITRTDKANDRFKERLNKKFIESFDNVTKSTIKNAELSGPLKTAVSTATSAFLIVDNYNLVMIDSQGKDKNLADQKAKERTIQRIMRIAYGAGIINMFNKIFSKTYSASLLGAQAITVGNSLLTETMERKSVGLPVGESTREEIVKMDNQNLQATGIKGAYFRLMGQLTGKKPLSQRKADNK